MPSTDGCPNCGDVDGGGPMSLIDDERGTVMGWSNGCPGERCEHCGARRERPLRVPAAPPHRFIRVFCSEPCRQANADGLASQDEDSARMAQE